MLSFYVEGIPIITIVVLCSCHIYTANCDVAISIRESEETGEIDNCFQDWVLQTNSSAYGLEQIAPWNRDGRGNRRERGSSHAVLDRMK